MVFSSGGTRPLSKQGNCHGLTYVVLRMCPLRGGDSPTGRRQSVEGCVKVAAR